MKVLANGAPVELPEGGSVEDLLHALGLASAWVVAELNGIALERAVMANTVLSEGDRIELVRAVAGG